MVSVGTLIISNVITAVIVTVVAVFVYRNNIKKFGKIADDIDVIYDKVEGVFKKKG